MTATAASRSHRTHTSLAQRKSCKHERQQNINFNHWMPRMHLADEWIRTMLASVHGHHVPEQCIGVVGNIWRNISPFIISPDYALTRCAFRFSYTFLMLSVHFDCWLFMCGLSFVGYETKRVKSSYSSAISITYFHFRRAETYFSNSISQRDKSQSTTIKVFFLAFSRRNCSTFFLYEFVARLEVFVWVVHLWFLSFSVLLRAYLGSMKLGRCLWCGWWGPLWCIMS